MFLIDEMSRNYITLNTRKCHYFVVSSVIVKLLELKDSSSIIGPPFLTYHLPSVLRDRSHIT